MTAAPVTEQRLAIAALLSEIPDCHAYALHPGNIAPPALWPWPVGDSEDFVFDGSVGERYFQIIGVASKGGGLGGAQSVLDAWTSRTGTQSVRAALLTDPTLNGTALGILEIRHQGSGEMILNDLPFLGATWLVTVLVEG